MRGPMLVRGAKKWIFGLVASLMAIGAVSQASATTVQVTYKGTVYSGGDGTNIFGLRGNNPGNPLGPFNGVPYTLIFDFSTPPGILTVGGNGDETLVGGTNHGVASLGSAYLTINNVTITTNGTYSGTDSSGIGGNKNIFYQYAQQYPGAGTPQNNLNYTFFEQIGSVNLPLHILQNFGPYDFTTAEQQAANNGSITYLDILNGTVAANVALSLVPELGDGEGHHRYSAALDLVDASQWLFRFLFLCLSRNEKRIRWASLRLIKTPDRILDGPAASRPASAVSPSPQCYRRQFKVRDHIFGATIPFYHRSRPKGRVLTLFKWL